MLSAQSLHVSRVAEGPWQGMPLSELWARQGEPLTGRKATTAGPFPLLLKILDCQQLLSVQVHPNDQIARQLRPGELGKTEAWVVLEADPTARVYAGLRPGTTRQQLEQHLDAGTVAECLHEFTPQKGQCLFLPAGIVHAVGGGVLMAEVQQTSDVTFRLFDWNRPGPDGKPRALHRQEALLAIDWSAGPVGPTTPRPIAPLPRGVRGERLVACPHFSIDRFELTAGLLPMPIPVESTGTLDLPYPQQLSLWMLLEGAAMLVGKTSGYRRTVRQGETVLVPATAGDLCWASGAGVTTLLGIPVP
jgi:mannose-6-phosphate isomerase